MNNEESVIPPQQSGAESDTLSTVTLPTPEEAKSFYSLVKDRLLHVNGWQSLAGAATARFQLTDAQGNDVDRTAQEGDYFKIDVPGPGPVTGDGYDWVQIEKIEEKNEGEEELIAIRVRPASNPNNSNKDVAHFFGPEATSNFIIAKKGLSVCAEVHGRNEKANTTAEKVVDKARNLAFAAGAVTGFSKLQWKSLVHGLLKK